MSEPDWRERQRVLEKRAADARKEGKEHDYLVYQSLAELLDRQESLVRIEMEELREKVAGLDRRLVALHEQVTSLVRKTSELETWLREEIE